MQIVTLQDRVGSQRNHMGGAAGNADETQLRQKRVDEMMVETYVSFIPTLAPISWTHSFMTDAESRRAVTAAFVTKSVITRTRMICFRFTASNSSEHGGCIRVPL
jgi:hypothetical protein